MNLKEAWSAYEAAEQADKDFLTKVNGHVGRSSEDNWTEAQKEEYARLQRDTHRAKSIVLGTPGSFDRVRCWMVDATGSGVEMSEPEYEKLMNAVMEDASKEKPTHSYVESSGGLAAEARKVMNTFNLTDSGSGSDGWHLGCHCTEIEAHQLCRKLHMQFAKAIDAGLLKVKRMAWALDLKEE